MPKIKISETFEKITNPGHKKLWRVYDENKKAVADLITLYDETPDFSSPYYYVDPAKPWKNRCFENCTLKELQHLVMKDGKRLYRSKPLNEIRKYVSDQLENEIWEEEQRFEFPHHHYIDMSPEYYKMKMELLTEAQKPNNKK